MSEDVEGQQEASLSGGDDGGDEGVDEETLESLREFCRTVEREGEGRVVVRWIDEKRPVHDDRGVAVEQVTEATVKAAVDGEVVTRTFEGVPYRRLREEIDSFGFETLFRSDNLTRRDL